MRMILRFWLRTHEMRRRVAGFVFRKFRWEFWPAWAAYAPLIPYLLFLAAKHRSLTVFTAANPGMYSGGLKGESKSQILWHLSRVPEAVAEFDLLSPGACLQAHRFPLVLKPDTGERGMGVAIIRSQAELDAYLFAADGPTIVQEYVSGREYGVYYVRYPDEPQGRVLSVTRKEFPRVTGDGLSTLRRLIFDDPRAVCVANTYLQASKRDLLEVPAPGESVPLVEIGSHCRGAIFLDGSHLITSQLTETIDRVSHAHPGFYIGRYDVRADSAEALQRGHFKVIELNGVAAEATHVYDPAVSIGAAYRTMARHWRMAFEVGAINRTRGARCMTIRELIDLALAGKTPMPSFRKALSVNTTNVA